jgi:hypothetical protein
MNIFTSDTVQAWGELEVPLFGLEKDWFGDEVTPTAGFSLIQDPKQLWFLANHRQPAMLHPQSRPGGFQSELWRYDVAELFIADPLSGHYFEFNLAANGAWWSCEFTGPRQRLEEAEIAMPEVATFAEMAPDGSWLAAMALPLDLLRARLDFSENSKINVTMILNSPAQKFLTAVKLGGDEPDFHRPAEFSQVSFVPLVS